MSQRFPTTNWSLVAEAQCNDTREGREALTTLCQAYWYPLYAYVRRQGYNTEEARDLTQAYFARLLEKGYLSQFRPEAGRFRSFLLMSLQRFLANESDRALALKRGGRQAIVSLDTETAEQRYGVEPAHDLTPEKIFERHWAKTVVKRVFERLGEEFSDRGRSRHFEQLRGYLTGDEPNESYQLAADNLGTTEGAVKAGVHRMRHRFGQLLRDEVAATVARPDQVEGEIRHLLAALT